MTGNGHTNGGNGGRSRSSSSTKKDFESDQDVRWCPGCGDYAILATVQSYMPELDIPRENIVFISGIGCAARFPYYMETYGFHSIHGRAPAIASGLAVARPELDVWVVTGDGDALSIGGNHLIHAMRRNVNLTILMFNNQIYGLTKGQYSPTSELGKVTKSTPFGSTDYPFNPISLAIGAECTFVARTIDNDRKHFTDILRKAATHRGTKFVEVYQNCNIFNDGAFDAVRDARTRTRQPDPARARQADPLRSERSSAVCSQTTTARFGWSTSKRSGRAVARPRRERRWTPRARSRCRVCRTRQRVRRRSVCSARSSVRSTKTSSAQQVDAAQRAIRRRTISGAAAVRRDLGRLLAETRQVLAPGFVR